MRFTIALTTLLAICTSASKPIAKIKYISGAAFTTVPVSTFLDQQDLAKYNTAGGYVAFIGTPSTDLMLKILAEQAHSGDVEAMCTGIPCPFKADFYLMFDRADWQTKAVFTSLHLGGYFPATSGVLAAFGTKNFTMATRINSVIHNAGGFVGICRSIPCSSF